MYDMPSDAPIDKVTGSMKELALLDTAIRMQKKTRQRNMKPEIRQTTLWLWLLHL